MERNKSDRPGNLGLLVLAPNSWLGQWVNRQQLFSRIGREHPVLYTTGGWFIWDRHASHWKQANWLGAFAAHDNVWVDMSPRFLMRTPKLRPVDDVILRFQVRRWKRFLSLSARGAGPLVAYIYHPMFLPYAKLLGADHVVYHAYDLYDHTPGWNDELERAEGELLRRADLVIAASDQIAEVLRSKVARAVCVLPNGADVAAFDRALDAAAGQPADLSSIPHPRLGWVGSLHPQVDYGLIAELARRRPDWNFVLVGQVVAHADVRADAARADCQTLRNVHFLGGKRVDEVPQYVANMDVNLMIYRLSDKSWIKAGYPLKLHEYLAVGHPVVSADLASVRPFSEVVRIAFGVDDWQHAIEEALQGSGRGTPEQRKAVAASNSWDHRAGVLKKWLTDLTTHRKHIP